MIRSLLFLWLLIASSSASVEPCDLACWLGNLTLDLGAHAFTGGRIEAFTCSNLQLGSLKSNFYPPYAVSANVSGLNLVCQVGTEQ